MSAQQLTYEGVLELIRESIRESNRSTNRSISRSIRKTSHLIKEQGAEFDRRMQETDRRMQETDQRMQETDQLIKRIAKENAKLGDRLGELVQSMVEGGIKRMFKDLGYDFDVINPKHNFGNRELNVYGEIDILLENGDFALLMEVKTNLSVDDVNELKAKLKKFRLVADVKNDKRRFIAAVGGGVVRKNVRDFALKQGIFVVQQSGENVEIIAPKGKPKVW